MQSQARPARILIVDDSAVMRALLRSVVGSDKRLEVEMPVMDGLHTLRQMKARGNRVPVIMCSSLTQRGAKVTIEALASGAADYVAKPSGQPSREAAVQALAQDLVPKILALTASAAGICPARVSNIQSSPAAHSATVSSL